jgi:hypothetical protein
MFLERRAGIEFPAKISPVAGKLVMGRDAAMQQVGF